MTKSVRMTVFALLAVVAVILGLTFNKFTQSPPLDREKLRDEGVFIFETPRTFSMAPLVDHENQSFSVDNMKDHWTLLYFGFTFCPDVCPTTLAKLNELSLELQELDNELAKRFKVVMVTVDPQRDTPAKLANYVPFFNRDFVGVTGDMGNIYELTRQLNVAFTPVGDTTKDDYLVEHSANVVLINPKGDYHGFIRPPFIASKLVDSLKIIDQVF